MSNVTPNADCDAGCEYAVWTDETVGEKNRVYIFHTAAEAEAFAISTTYEVVDTGKRQGGKTTIGGLRVSRPWVAWGPRIAPHLGRVQNIDGDWLCSCGGFLVAFGDDRLVASHTEHKATVARRTSAEPLCEGLAPFCCGNLVVPCPRGQRHTAR